VAAAELDGAEYRHGLARLEHLCTLLRPAAIAFCGLTGWRAATGHRSAVAGWQDRLVGPTPAYVLPNPSGLNAHTSAADLAAHLSRAAAGPVAEAD
jgi:TDG/mug DNA glycosylase family protein